MSFPSSERQREMTKFDVLGGRSANKFSLLLLFKLSVVHTSFILEGLQHLCHVIKNASNSREAISITRIHI